MLDRSTKSKSNGRQLNLIAFLIVGIGSLYFFFDSMLVVFPVALTSQLMHQFQISATGVSLFAALYFYVYAPMQFPCGYLLDRFGPKRIMIAGCFISTLALLLFANTHSFFISGLARVLMGLGASAGYLAPMLLVVKWFPRRYYVIMTGSIVFIESVGAIFGGPIISHLTSFLTFRSIILLMALIGFLLLVLVIIFVKDKPSDYLPEERHAQPKIKWRSLIQISTNIENWSIAFVATFLWAPISIFAALWGIPFLKTADHLSKSSASNLLIMVWLGVGLVSPIWGYISNTIGRRCFPLQLASAMGLLSALALIFFSHMNLITLALTLFLMGAASAGQVLTFGIMHDKYVNKDAACAFGFNNMMICFGNAIFQFITGFLLDFFWKGRFIDGIKVYSSSTFKISLFTIPLCYIFVFILSTFFIKESFCTTLLDD